MEMARSNLTRRVVCVMAMVASAVAPVASAQPVGGPEYGVHQIPAYSTHWFDVNFREGESGNVVVYGDGDTYLELKVYDSDSLVSSDGGYGCLTASWYTFRGGSFRIEIVNHGSVYNEYEIVIS
jgi:hypothetical protein